MSDTPPTSADSKPQPPRERKKEEEDLTNVDADDDEADDALDITPPSNVRVNITPPKTVFSRFATYFCFFSSLTFRFL